MSAFSEPRPVSDRTYSSWYVRSAPRSVLSIVPSQQPMNPSGIETMPGFASSQPIGEPVTLSAPGQTFGDTITSAIELTTPNSTPVTAPVVLNRRQISASSSAGKLALAATANARPTMNDTFRPEPPMIATSIAIAPMLSAAIRATQT